MRQVSCELSYIRILYFTLLYFITDAPKLSCPPVGALVADTNVCMRCDVNAKPRPSSTLWVVDANGTSLAEGQVLDDYWTFSTVRIYPSTTGWME